MSGVTPYDAIKAFAQAQFSPTYPVLDADSIDDTLAQGEDPFMALEEVSGDEEIAGFGDSSNICFREEGVITVHGFVSSPESSGTARVLGDQIRDAFRQARFGGVYIRTITPPDLVRLNTGLWTQVSVSLGYRFDFHAPIPVAQP